MNVKNRVSLYKDFLEEVGMLLIVENYFGFIGEGNFQVFGINIVIGKENGDFFQL